MKIVGINTKYTKTQDFCIVVALNIDAFIGEKIIEQLNKRLKKDSKEKHIETNQDWYIYISAIKNEDRLLNAEIKVIENKDIIEGRGLITPMQEFGKEHVETINNFLHEIEKEREREEEDRNDFLEKLEKRTEIPLDNRKKARFV